MKPHISLRKWTVAGYLGLVHPQNPGIWDDQISTYLDPSPNTSQPWQTKGHLFKHYHYYYQYIYILYNLYIYIIYKYITYMYIYTYNYINHIYRGLIVRPICLNPGGSDSSPDRLLQCPGTSRTQRSCSRVIGAAFGAVIPWRVWPPKTHWGTLG